MKTMRMCAMVVMSAALCRGASGGESPAPAGTAVGGRSPEQLGAHWARVSDEAEIQLIVDELRTTGGGTDGVVRKRVSPNIQPARLCLPAGTAAGGQSLVVKGGAQEAMLKSTGVAAERLPAGQAGWSVKVRANAATVDFSSGEKLQLQKDDGSWKVIGGALPQSFTSAKVSTVASLISIGGESGASAGQTFIPIAMSTEHGIERLTRHVTQSKIERQLFGVPEKIASYFSVRYMKTPPFVQATYVQLILDSEWNRIVYGNLDRWIKTYNLQSPSAIAVDADGNVFVGEPANKRVLVLKLVGSGDEVELQHRHQMNDIVNPTDLAIDDNGTPFNTNDDYLYVADASRNTIFKYTAGAHRNALVASFDGFDAPTSITVGRWNGANDGLLYVVDKIAKRIRVFDVEGGSLSLISEFKGEYSQYFKSIKTDHFGNVYVVENVNSKVIKFTPSLEELDAEGGDETFAALGAIDIPFAKIVVDGEGSYWTGFDQLFAIERWDNASGAQRRKLGVKLKNISFRADADVSVVSNAFVLTDVGNVDIRIYDENKRLVRTLTSSWMNAGQKDLQWDRRNDEGAQVSAGTYRYEIGATSAYGGEPRGGEPTISSTRFYLPMYYYEDCGSANRADDAHLVQGSVVAWGTSPSQTANEHVSSVQYRFTGLNPAGEYEVAAELVAAEGAQRLQDLTANGVRLIEPVRVTSTPTTTAFVKLPQASYSGGEVTIAVNTLAEGSAIVSQLWIKEVGVGFNPQPIAAMPRTYMLEQNYPNPFNPTTTIRYAIPNDGVVTLKVYNINGQEVATVVNEPKSAGKYEVIFSATGGSASGGNGKSALGNSLSSGVYFYQVRSGTYSETKKMLLLK